MITFISSLILASLILLISVIDMYIFNQPFIASLLKVLGQIKGTNEWMIYMGLVSGLLYSVVIDYRLKKAKGSKKKEAI